MKRLVLAGTFCLAFLAPAYAVSLLDVRVAAPVTAASQPDVPFAGAVRASSCRQSSLTRDVHVRCRRYIGRAWVQTSIDGGTTWIDVANFHFTKSAARFLCNLSSGDPGEHRVRADRRNVGSEYVEGRLGRPDLAGQIHRRGHLHRGNDIARRRLRPGRHVLSMSDLVGNAHGSRACSPAAG